MLFAYNEAMKTIDILIIGLGPAGATFARLIDPAYSVLALDAKDDSSDSFRKPCGGLLAPDAQRTIAEMNLHLPKDVLVDPQIFSVHTIDVPAGLDRHYQRAYFNLDRHAFDRWLIRLLPDSVEIARGTRVTNIKTVDDGYLVSYTRGDTLHQAKARYLVGADGANSPVRRFLYPQHKIRTYLAIQEWYPSDTSQPVYASIFDPRITDCYSWALNKDDAFIFGGAYPQDKARERFERQKQTMLDYGYPLHDPFRREACLVLRPSRTRDIVTGHDNAYLIGEAAGFISPSSLEGISFALISARELATAFPSRPRYRKLRRRIVGKLIKSPFLYQPLLRRLIMKSGVQAIHVSKTTP